MLLDEKKLKKWMYIALGISFCVQVIIVVYYWGRPQYSDCGEYIRMAQKCFARGEWYPMRDNLYDEYIWSIGHINFLILQLKLFGTVNSCFLFNLLFQLGLIWDIYYLGKHFFTRRTACIAVICYSLLYSNLMIVAPIGTELPFLWLTLTAFVLCLKPYSWKILCAGILFALGNTVRPLVPIFLVVLVVYMLLNHYKFKYYLILFLSLGSTILLVGTLVQKKTNRFIYQATTSGVNLIMAANDEANGGVVIHIFSDSTSIAWIDNASRMDFAEKDSVWRTRAIEWIKKHPGQFAKLYLLKLGGVYIEDSWSDRHVTQYKSSLGSAMAEGASIQFFLREAMLRGVKSLLYYGVLFCFIYAVVVHYKEWFTNKGILLLLFVIGTMATCIFPAGPRYHYPYLFTIVLWAAHGIETWLERRKIFPQK